MTTTASSAAHTPGEDTDQSPADLAEAILDHIIAAKGGQRRAGQVHMARSVATSLTERQPLLLQGGTGIGKALDVDTPIPTPDGFVAMGSLKVGDLVYGEHGRPVKVTRAYAVLHDRDCFQVTFSDGTSIVADAEHLWSVTDAASVWAHPDDPWEDSITVTTSEVAGMLADSKRVLVPVTVPVQGGLDADGPVDPYVLGLWLAGTTANGTQASVGLQHAPASLDGFTRTDGERRATFAPDDDTLAALEALGVVGSKHIPATYMHAPLAQRESLLAGLLDASGFVTSPARSRGQVQFTEVEQSLASDVHTLVCSLGYRPSLLRRDDGKVRTWLVTFSPGRHVFGSQARNDRIVVAEQPRPVVRSIVSVKPVESRPVRCIEVDSPRHLYLAGKSYVATHNSIGEIAGALAFGRPVVIAPHTKALQDQLHGDLTLVAEAFATCGEDSPLRRAPRFAVIKGRSAYLCRNKMAGPEESEGPDGTPALLEVESPEPGSDLGREVKALYEWADEAAVGDRSEVPFPVSNRAWEQVSVTAEGCTGKACPFYTDGSCFAERARQRAKQADIIVTNQAFLGQAMRLDMAVGKPLLLPDTVRGIIVDEAHEFPSVVANTFGAQVTVDRIVNAAKKTTLLDSLGLAQAEAARERVESSARALEKVLTVPKDPDRKAVADPKVVGALEVCEDAVRSLRHLADGLSEADEDATAKKTLLCRMLDNLVFDLALLQMGTTDTQVAWVEPRGRKAVLRSAQFDVSDRIHSRLLGPFGSVVFTSATLTVAGRFDQPAKDYGFTLSETGWKGEVVESPFDYPTQGLLWYPPDMPQPINSPAGSKAYLSAVGEVAAKAAKAAGGRTLVLCTSWASVQAISEYLRVKLGAKHPVLVQEPGEPTKSIAQRFADEPEAVLVGTRTFWSGVSIEGPTCACVVLDKSPFPSPGDPIIAARSEKADRNGGSGFREVSLPEAILTTVQGAGRLIRTVHDEGVVIVCDPRVHPSGPHRKGYARDVARSLPPFAIAKDWDEVTARLSRIDATADDSQDRVEVEEGADE